MDGELRNEGGGKEEKEKKLAHLVFQELLKHTNSILGEIILKLKRER